MLDAPTKVYFPVPRDLARRARIHRLKGCPDPQGEQKVGTTIFSPATLRKIVREELRAESDRQSFVVPSPWMTLDAVCEYLGMSRETVRNLRDQRKRAKSKEAKDHHFAPEVRRENSSMIQFHKDDIDAWMRRHMR